MINDIDPTEKNLGDILRRIKNHRAELGSFGKFFHASSTSHADLTAAWKSNRRSTIVKASSERIQCETRLVRKLPWWRRQASRDSLERACSYLLKCRNLSHGSDRGLNFLNIRKRMGRRSFLRFLCPLMIKFLIRRTFVMFGQGLATQRGYRAKNGRPCVGFATYFSI